MQKMMHSIVAIATTALLITGCKSKDTVSSDPKTVLVTFFERMAKKDIDGAAKLATKDSKAALDMMKKAIDLGEKMKDAGGEVKEEDPTEDFRSMEFGDVKIDGDMATVPVKNTKKNESFDFPLKKEGGGWKVDFSMSTLMKMGMDKAKESNDVNQEDLDKLNNFNMDSLKKSLEVLDSSLKTIDPKQMDQVKEAMKELEKLKDQ